MVAAFSLEVAERTRAGLSKRVRQEAAERRMERSSSDLFAVQDVKSQLCEALRQMLSKTSTRESTAEDTSVDVGGLKRLPITVKPLPADDSDPECADALAINAMVRDISKNIIGLSHSSPIDSQRVVLSVETADGGSLRLVGEPQWQLPLRDGSFQSGVRLL
ncbi:MAG: hypothetical protein HZA46_21315 [Planctomycetales bacterium]|nr:hypothetical protein [Planctomycetales bacterium]